jgi:hypothetical protein
VLYNTTKKKYAALRNSLAYMRQHHTASQSINIIALTCRKICERFVMFYKVNLLPSSTHTPAPSCACINSHCLAFWQLRAEEHAGDSRRRAVGGTQNIYDHSIFCCFHARTPSLKICFIPEHCVFFCSTHNHFMMRASRWYHQRDILITPHNHVLLL